MSQELTVVGVMSGTSLDGVDVCCVRFFSSGNTFNFEWIAAETFDYSLPWKKDLQQAFHLDQQALNELNVKYGRYLGELIADFLRKYKLDQVDLIGSHGHTIFHQPDQGITLQIGDGKEICKKTQIKTVSDFRSLDVRLGGQGAPLVPIGDQLLFSDYEACLNLGGIANISFDKKGSRIAFDICPCNLPLNKIAQEVFGTDYDRGGEVAKSGRVNNDLLTQLNQLPYYQQSFPKSLGVEWLNENFYPLLDKKDLKPEDLLRTIVEHETDQISEILNVFSIKNCLITGGGALNTFFMEKLKEKTTSKIEQPDTRLIHFKEALIFAFLAYLRVQNKINTLASVTGASRDSTGGVLHVLENEI
ncbi:MAG: anhydro-N-acetylmuramic acid kinase [Crocinitomicaceae bacterium]